MSLLLNDLLDIARVTQGKLELRKQRVRLTDVVDSAVEEARPLLDSKNHQLMAAMQRAEESISDILAALSRQFHRIRQESIDEELFEVVSGYEALSKGGP